jgi:hypothetical protein
MQEVIERAGCGPELLPFPAAVSSAAADGLSVNVRAKKASWLSVAADRRDGGGVRVTINSDGEKVVAEVTAGEGERRAYDGRGA